MKRIIPILVTLLLSMSHPFAQNFEMEGSEIGFDVAFSASTNGGNAGIGLKYGINLGENLILGPSVRYERTWVKNVYSGYNGGYNVYGGGVFTHIRFLEALFVGAEFEMLKSPYNSTGYLTSISSSWAPTLFIGGGFSKEFNDSFRINAGLMYDIIDNLEK